jgi:hypothetical protein
MRTFLFLSLLLLVLPAAAQQQPYPQPPRADVDFDEPEKPDVIERFSGPIRFRRGPGAGLVDGRVVLRQWHIQNRQRIEIPHEGTLLVHLRSGELTAVIGGNRSRRRTDEFWIVPAGETFVVETGVDSVALQTVDVIVPPRE